MILITKSEIIFNKNISNNLRLLRNFWNYLKTNYKLQEKKLNKNSTESLNSLNEFKSILEKMIKKQEEIITETITFLKKDLFDTE